MYETCIDAALKLVDKYRSITLEELEESEDNSCQVPYHTLGIITGFNDKRTCSICQSVNGECNDCIYSFKMPKRDDWYYCVDDITYGDIYDSESYEELLEAINKRADYIEDLVNRIKNDNSRIILQNNSSE